MRIAMKTKPVSASAINDYVYQVFPNDLNSHRTVFGGRVTEIMDRVAGVVAQRHSGKLCVTRLIDSLCFLAPVKKGEHLIFKAAVNRVWHSSMEVGVKVFAEDPLRGKQRHVVSAYLTFVALNQKHNPTKAIPIIPETDDEKRRYQEADKRRQYRLAQNPR